MPTYTTPDVSWVNIVGMFWRGEAGVQRAHQAIFNRIYQGVCLPPADPGNLTFGAITPDVVLVTSRSTMPVRSDGPPPTGAPPAAAAAIFNTLLVKRQGS